MEKLKIFISGTQDDMKPERDAVDRAVNASSLSTGVRAETAVSQPQSPRAWIEQQIRECNIYIGVYSHRYGWVIPDENVSATEFEFNLARKLGKPVLVWIRKQRDEEKSKPNIDRQEQFLSRVSDFSTGHLRQEFDNPTDLEKWVAAALGETFTEIIRRGTAPNTSKFLVPFPHNPDFVGRDAELASLHEMLQHGGSIVGIRPTVLVGLGGIGKTQLAVEYAHAHRADYPNGVFWLNAINPLLFEFSDLAEKLDMADRDTPRDKAARKAWDYLDSHPDLLVIFDNVLEPSELNVPFSPDLIPANLSCRTLFTTRQRDFPRTFQPFELKVLPEMAAMKLLLRSRPEVLEEHHPEWGWARIVCAELGWLPLALELAAAYLGAYPEVSITGYLERLRTEGSLETVDESEVRAIDLPTRVEEILKAVAAGNLELKHQVAVSATLQTQWKRLDDEDAKLLFRAAGQFPEASWIPSPRLGLLTGIENVAKPGHPSPLNFALKKLHAASLIEELSNDRLRLHPLVQQFAARLSPESFRLELTQRAIAELYNLLSLQIRVSRLGVDMVLEDIQTAISLSKSQTENDIYNRLFYLKHILMRQARHLTDWDIKRQPAFFLQQVRNDAYQIGLKDLENGAEEELIRQGLSYISQRFKVVDNSLELVHTLVGHADIIPTVTVTPDNRFAISGSWDKTIKIWDLINGNEIQTLRGHKGEVTEVTASPDGRYLASVSEHTVKIWELKTGRAIYTLKGYKGWGHTNKMMIDKNSIVFVGKSPLFFKDDVLAWDLVNERLIHRWTGFDTVVRLTMTQNGHVLALSSSELLFSPNEKFFKIRDLTGEGEVTCPVKNFYINRIEAVTLDSRFAIGSSPGSTELKVIDLMNGQIICSFMGHTSSCKHIAVTSDNRVAISSQQNSANAMVWDLRTGEIIHELEGHMYGANRIAITPDDRFAITASDDCTLKIWDLSNGQCIRTLQGHAHRVDNVVVTSDGHYAVSTSWDRTIRTWDLSIVQELNQPNNYITEAAKNTATIDGHLDVSPKGWVKYSDDWGEHDDRLRVNGIAVLLNSPIVISASLGDRTLKVWDAGRGKTIRSLMGHRSSVSTVAVTPDGRSAVSASVDKNIKIWDFMKGETVHNLPRQMHSVNHIAVTPDNQFAILASGDELDYRHIFSILTLWMLMYLGVFLSFPRLRTDSSWLGQLRSYSGLIIFLAIAILIVYLYLAIGSTIRILDIKKGKFLYTYRGHFGKVNKVDSTSDGHFAISASSDHTLKIWDLINKRIIRTLRGHKKSVNSVVVTSDNHLIISASSDFTIMVWGFTSGQVIRTLRGHKSSVNSVAVTPDCRLAISVSSDCTLRVWNVATGEVIAILPTNAPLNCCAILADGKTIVAGDESGKVHFWELIDTSKSRMQD